MNEPARRRLRITLGLAVFVTGFAAAAASDSAWPALIGSLGLLAGLLAIERYPRSLE